MRNTAVLCLALALGACSEPLELADWTVPPPDGVPLREYPGIPFHERSERIDLVEDLVIGERDGDENYRLYDSAGAEADRNGNFHVLDAGNHRVQVFDANGEYVRTLGRRGQGPSELMSPTSLVIAGDRFTVLDSVNRRYSAWALSGEHLRDDAFAEPSAPLGLYGFDDGTMLGRVMSPRGDTPLYDRPYLLLILSGDGRRLAEVQELLRVPAPTLTRETAGRSAGMRLPIPVASPSYAATHDGDIYTTLSQEYQIYAFDHETEMRWALRATWERTPITEEEIAAGMQRIRERIPDASRSEIDIPESKPAISYITVDGHGHLYVYPYTDAFDAPEVPVDVYSRDGEALFSGWIPAVRWSDARGDFVYGREADEQTGEERIIRYRVVEPFEERIQVLFPVPLGPNRKKDRSGGVRDRVNIDTKFTVKSVAISIGP